MDMPFYQFKKILDDPTVDQNEKEHSKARKEQSSSKELSTEEDRGGNGFTEGGQNEGTEEEIGHEVSRS